MTKISVVMPFLNEGYEPINTILSINFTIDPTQVEIIAICDAPEYEFEEKIKEFSNVRFIKNKHKVGVDGCRSMGIYLAKSPVTLVIDAHMRFAFDDWVNKIYDVVMDSPKTIWCTRSVVLYDSMTSAELNPHRDVTQISNHYSVGSRMRYHKPPDTVPFNMDWIHTSSFLNENDGYLTCILGANYAGSTEWLRYIRSFEGLIGWGFSEQYISVKNWLLGGDCRGLDTVSIGHIFRKKAPYHTPYRNQLYNIIFTANVLFPEELDIFENYISLIETQHEFKPAIEMIEARWDVVCSYREYFLSKKIQTLTEYFDRFNIQYKDTVYGKN